MGRKPTPSPSNAKPDSCRGRWSETAIAPVYKHSRGLLLCLALLGGLPWAAQAVPSTGGAAFCNAAGVPAPTFLRTGDIVPLAYTGPNLNAGFTVMTWIRPQGTQFNCSGLFKFGTDPSSGGLYFQPNSSVLHFNFLTPNGPGSVNAPAALPVKSWSLVTRCVRTVQRITEAFRQRQPCTRQPGGDGFGTGQRLLHGRGVSGGQCAFGRFRPLEHGVERRASRRADQPASSGARARHLADGAGWGLFAVATAVRRRRPYNGRWLAWAR